MTEIPTLELRKSRNLSEILNDSFLFLRIHAKTITGPYLLVTLPLALLAVFPTYTYTHSIYNQTGEGLGAGGFGHFTFDAARSLIIMSLLYSISYLAGMAMVFAYVQTYFDKGNVFPTFAESLTGFGRKFPTMVLSSIPIFLLLALGFVLLFIPGIWFSIISLVFYPVLIFENLSFLAALKRSRYLVKGAWWQTFFIVFIAGILIAILSGFVSFFFGIFAVVGHLNDLNHPDLGGIMFYVTLIPQFFKVLLQIFVDVTVMLQYFNLREEKEGSSLVDRISSMGTTTKSFVQSSYKEEF